MKNAWRVVPFLEKQNWYFSNINQAKISNLNQLPLHLNPRLGPDLYRLLAHIVKMKNQDLAKITKIRPSVKTKIL